MTIAPQGTEAPLGCWSSLRACLNLRRASQESGHEGQDLPHVIRRRRSRAVPAFDALVRSHTELSGHLTPTRSSSLDSRSTSRTTRRSISSPPRMFATSSTITGASLRRPRAAIGSRSSSRSSATASTRRLVVNPADKIKPPKKANVERQAYSPDVIEQLRAAQPTMREQIAVQLLGLLGLRKNELRLLQVKDFDLGGQVSQSRSSSTSSGTQPRTICTATQATSFWRSSFSVTSPLPPRRAICIRYARTWQRPSRRCTRSAPREVVRLPSLQPCTVKRPTPSNAR